MIKYSDIKRGKYTTSEISRYLKDRISKESYFYTNRYEIVFDCLAFFNFKKITNEKKSIEEYSLKILESPTFKLPSLKKNPIKYFLLLFLDIKELPLRNKAILEKKAKNHLQLVNDILNHYLSLQFIKDFLDLGQKPRNHNQGTVLEFYKRTVAKKEEIQNYLIHSIEERALEKSTNLFQRVKKDLGDLHDKIEPHNDFPYFDFVFDLKSWDWKYKIDIEKLDYREINTIRHKIPIIGKIDLDKNIDKQIISLIKPKKILLEIIKESRISPILEERLAIFSELKLLFQEKRWYGFYALGLPQIEGIFTQMNKILKAQGKIRIPNSLPGKVSNIRAKFKESDDIFYNFDYYEFSLPNLRNKFSHSGKDSDIKIKSYHLLLDLRYLISIVIALDASVIQLANILKEGGFYFRNIVSFATFFTLLKQVKKNKHFNLLEKQFKKFVKVELLTKFNLLLFIDKLDIDIKNTIPEFEQQLNLALYIYNKEKVDLSKLSNKELIKYIDIIIPAIQEDWLLITHQHFKFFDSVNVFIAGISKLVDDKKIIKRIDLLEKKYNQLLQRVKIINSKLSTELSDNIIILESKFEHSLNFKN